VAHQWLVSSDARFWLSAVASIAEATLMGPPPGMTTITGIPEAQLVPSATGKAAFIHVLNGPPGLNMFTSGMYSWCLEVPYVCLVVVIIMYIYHALVNALSTHMMHTNLNMIFYTHVEHSPTKQFT